LGTTNESMMDSLKKPRKAAYHWIEAQPQGRAFENSDLYRMLEKRLPDQCSRRGDAENEPRYKNDARWAVQDALRASIIGPTGYRGRFQRL
jgi:hypothetical protein